MPRARARSLARPGRDAEVASRVYAWFWNRPTPDERSEERRRLPSTLARERELQHRGAADGEARAGILRTAHGEVRTPAFMPVGTKATVKSVDPDELHALGADIVLGNTYHLHFRPGEELIAELGGLHTFMGWDGAILTDSGGFQVFSLRDTLLAADDDGVTFRSVYDGRPERFTPELSARDPGAARLGRRDVPRHLPARGRPARRAR